VSAPGRLSFFRLSGVDYDGDIGNTLYGIAWRHGFSRMGADMNPWPMPRAGSEPLKFVCEADVSGISAAIEVEVDGVEGIVEFLRDAPLVQRDEATALAAYREMLAAIASAKAVQP
jgi:hypothetical protein